MGEFTRKLGDYEELMYECLLRDFMRIRYTLVFNSKQPLVENDVRTAMQHLYRKIPSLRMCVQRRENNELWFKVMDKEMIDLKMLPESVYEDEFRKALVHKTDLDKGPLWCVRVFPNSKECRHPEVKAAFPHQYNVMFIFQHPITDGTSNVRICKHFLDLLNDVIAKRPIDEEQFGFHASPEDFKSVIDPLVKNIVPGSKRFLEIKEYLEKYDKAPNYFAQAFASPDSPSSTESVIHDFTSERTQKMLSKCRENGVTINSFMCIAIQAAIYEMLQSTSFAGKEEYEIPNIQLVNQRRYLNDPNEKAFGCFATLLHTWTSVKPDIKQKFWTYAQEFHSQVKKRIESAGIFEEDCCRKYTVSPDYEDAWLTDDPNHFYNLYYATSNLGNLDKTFPGTGDHVQATYINRTSTITKLHSLHELHTFRGRLLYTIDYWSKLMAKDKVELWMTSILNIIDQILDQ